MIYLRCNDRGESSFSYKWLEVGTLYKIEEKRVSGDGLNLGTYYGIPKFYFEEISKAEVLVECYKQGITIETIKEIR